MNDSSTGGYLSPTGTSPLADADLADAFQAMVVGITGLAGKMVRPRWQPNPPPQPEASIDWCAIGVQPVETEGSPYIAHDGSGDGSDSVTQWETVEVLASFYGPAGQANAIRLRDGIVVPQNCEGLLANGIVFVEARRVVQANALVNQTWFPKYDLALTFRRQVTRTYPILNLLSADGTIGDGIAPDQPFEVEP